MEKKFVERKDIPKSIGYEDLYLKILESLKLYDFNEAPKFCGGTLVKEGCTAKVEIFTKGKNKSLRTGAFVIVRRESEGKISIYKIAETLNFEGCEGYTIEEIESVRIN